MAPREKDALLDRISAMLTPQEYVVFAYIFGSFVSEKTFHDIDIAIYISSTDISPLKLELEAEALLENALHIPVDVRIVNQAPVSFVYHVLKGGKVIVDKNKSLRSDFEGLIFKKYFDVQHLRREYLREIVHAPV